MSNLPAGEVTFLFTDLQGSTALWDQRPDEMNVALEHHDRVMRDAIGASGGYVFSTAGDSFGVAFASADAALATALRVQLELLHPAGELALRARMGLHTGTAAIRDGDYFGTVVNRCARISAAAHGGQILVSDATLRALEGTLPAGVEVVFLGVHRLKDLIESERIHQICHPELQRDFPKIKTLEGPGDGLPIQLTTFVGRGRELSEIRALLDGHRLVTLTGPGGSGKTRLSLQSAADAANDFPDGIRLVELAAITNPDVFVDEVADRFGVQAERDTPLVDTLVAAIAKREMLLVLDNCEHMVAPVADLGRRLTAACPGLKILATSRERLGVDGEVTYRVPTLELPVAGGGLEESLACDAVRLFVDRARLAVPTFDVTAANVADVVAICRRLDGIPLALELAAARVRALSPAQIAARLDERFRLLTAGTDRSRSQRQQTLLAAIEWSHNLLSEDEQIVFRRVSTFVSDFGLEAAEQVCSGGAIHELDVVDLLTALVDKSMVTPEFGRDAGIRHQLLESIREFGLQQLDASGERAEVSLRYVEWYTSFAERIQALQRGGNLTTALELLEEEEDNVRASLRYALDHDLLVHAARLVGALGYLWYVAGLHREGIEWCKEVFDRQPVLPDDVRAQALHTYGTLLGSWTRPDLGIEMIAEEVELRRRLEQPPRLASALNNLGNLMYDIGRFDEAEDALRESVEQFRRAGESPSLALCTLAYGQVHAGHHDRAEVLYAEALEEAARVSDAYGVALATAGLGQCAVRTGRHAEARLLLLDARDAFEDLKVSPAVADADFNLALVARGEGSLGEAAWRLLMSLTTSGAHWYDDTKFWIAQVTASMIDDLPTAARFVGAADAQYESAPVAQPHFLLHDLDATQRRLEEQLGPLEFQRCRVAGALLDLPTLVDQVTRVLRDFHDPTTTEGPG